MKLNRSELYINCNKHELQELYHSIFAENGIAIQALLNSKHKFFYIYRNKFSAVDYGDMTNLLNTDEFDGWKLYDLRQIKFDEIQNI